LNRRKRSLSFMICLCAFLILVGCGIKDEQEIIEDLSERLKELSSYESYGKMVVRTGQEPIVYDVAVWYKKPHFFRVSLKNQKKKITQILLRNHQGVFVVTPHLKKSFRFQSDWPNRGGQVYLYQTIMNNIVQDPKRSFQPGEDRYQFEVTAHYTAQATPTKQRIWLDRDLYPTKVHVLDQDHQQMVEVTFDRFKANVSFDDDAFELKRNMSSSSSTSEARETAGNQQPVQAMIPAYVPKGSQFQDEQVIETSNGPVSMLRFRGKNPFTLMVRRPTTIEAGLPVYGEPILLDQGVGVFLTMDQRKQISWIDGHLEYDLVGNLPSNEMVKIANSIFDQTSK
jgi:outer membrane lipoprotein-sorting protein